MLSIKNFGVFIKLIFLYHCFLLCTGLDYDDNIADISFISGQGVGDASCTNIAILVDSMSELEESFTIALLENSLVEVVQPNVSTVFIGEAG